MKKTKEDILKQLGFTVDGSDSNKLLFDNIIRQAMDDWAKQQINDNNCMGDVGNSDLIDYIENDAEIAMPIDEMFNEDGTHITKKQYGKVLLKYLVKELRAHYE